MNLQSLGTIFLAWIALPLLIVLISGGVGLALQRLAEIEPGVLTVPTGFAGSIVLFSLLLGLGIPADVCSIAVALLAIAGGALYLRGNQRLDSDARATLLVALGAAGAAYLIGIAPLVGSGRIGVLGYVLLNDPAWHLTLIDWIHANGLNPAAVPDSSIGAVSGQLSQGYPVGTYAWPLIAITFLGVDGFAIWTPTAAVALAMVAMVAFAAIRATGASKLWCGLAGTLIGVGYLPLSYLAQGGLKEVTFTFTFVFAAFAVTTIVLSRDDGFVPAWRKTLAAAVGIASMIYVFGPGAALWILPLVGLAVGFALLVRPDRVKRSRILLLTGAWGASLVVIALPAVIDAFRVLGTVSGVAGDSSQTGNLLGPVPIRETLNLWLSHDYRLPDPREGTKTWVLMMTAAAGVLAAVGGIRELFAKRMFIPIAGAAGFVVIQYLERKYNVYFVAKSYVAFAPIAGCATVAGLVWLVQSKGLRKALGIGLAGAFTATIAVALVVSYGSVFLSPEERFEELSGLNERLKGKGPTLVNEREEYARVLLPDAKPWESFGLFTPDRGFREGGGTGVPFTPDVDWYSDAHMARFNAIVSRIHPGNSRPPSNFERWLATDHYEVWRRVGEPPKLHVAVGLNTPTGSAALKCNSTEIQEAVRTARESDSPILLAVSNRDSVIVPAAKMSGNSEFSDPYGFGTRARFRNGRAYFTADLTPGVEYRGFISGAFGTGSEVFAADRSIGSVEEDLGQQDQWKPLASFKAEGPTKIRIEPAKFNWWHGGFLRTDDIRAMAFVPVVDKSQVMRLSPEELADYCGRQVDWVEVVD